MRLSGIRWLLLPLLASVLWGCMSGEPPKFPAPVVIDGRVIPDGGYTLGKSYTVIADKTIAALNGHFNGVTDAEVVFTLNGKRVLISSVRGSIPCDIYVGGGVLRFGGVLQIDQLQLEAFIPKVFPGGKAFRKGDKIFVQTSS